MTEESVQVALRIRPLVNSEVVRGCETCLDTVPGEPQVQVKGLAFTYNYVFAADSTQADFYDGCIKPLVAKLFKGYNATILAYGQTGSGKTHSMGTAYTDDPYEAGVIPRAVADIFRFVEDNRHLYEFKVSVSFVELYQEQLYDLLSNKSRNENVIDIREDNKGVVLPGLTEQAVTDVHQTLACLVRGSEGRATGSTAMNNKSSRSHAIFTVNILQENKEDRNQSTTSKFHLVDLAGSERSKKTKATGDRFKEGVKINQGLLALGNVISALGDGSNRGYVCYRDSKLTRLLQDSLGGNSMTLMIACVSPADYNLEETVSTLRYADRARQIKNKPIINQDAKSAEINRLNSIIQQLRLQILNEGKALPQDVASILKQLEDEKLKNINLSEKYSELVMKNKNLTNLLQITLGEQTNMVEKVILVEASKEKVEKRLAEIIEECNQTIEHLKDKGTNQSETIHSISKICSNITDLQSEQKQCSQIISNLINDDNTQIDSEENQSANADQLNESDINDKEEAYTLDQVARSNELKDLAKSLSEKKHLAEKLAANNQYLNTYNESMKESEHRISMLEKEKDELLQQLKHKSKSDPHVASEYKTKIHSLEHEISELKKKCQQQANLIKMKERNDLKIQTLNNEIQQMKAAKVRLIKSMRSENDKFRAWKLQNEKRIVKLCNNDRKMQSAMVRMENQFTKQQFVLKRKMEDAVAANKRLKEALDRQTHAKKQRIANGNGKSHEVQQIIDEELELVGSLGAAEITLKGLMEDRGTLTEQLEILKQENPDDVNIPVLMEDIQLRNAQIADLQQKILAGDQENKAKCKFETIQSMAEVKLALKYLFDVAAEAKREISTQKSKDERYKELKDICKNANEKITILESKLKENHARYKMELTEIEKLHEEKLSTLIKQLHCVRKESDASSRNDLLDRLEIMQDAFERMKNSKTELLAENEVLKQENDNIKIKKLKKPAKKKVLDETFIKTELGDDDSDEHDDSLDDPDWDKPTTKKGTAKASKSTQDLSSESHTVKRSSEGHTKCSCKTKCSTKVCSCKKLGLMCGENCKCNNEKCINQSNSILTASVKSEDVTHTNNENCDFTNIKTLTEGETEDVKKRRTNKTENWSKLAEGKKKRTFFYHDKDDVS